MSDSNYKDTLNLPNTPFPMRANLVQREPTILKKWQQQNLYHQLNESNSQREVFILADGPPYANGRPHMGTAFNKVLKDIINKAHLLSGFRVPFVPGWDCHGLPIELNVEKKVGRVGQKVDARTFRQKCRDYAAKQIDIQREDFQRLGVLADWAHPYKTMDASYEANIIRALANIIDRGHLVRGEKPVYWSPLGHTAAAEAEVEYKTKQSHAIDVAFFAVDPAAVAAAFNVVHTIESVAFPIWTTTPWTLPANQAVAIHPELEYALVKMERDGQVWHLVMAADLVEAVAKRYHVALQSIATVAGDKLEKQLLQHPFLDRQVPVVLAEHVTTEAGTGNVHTAPAHGEDDYYVGKRYGLPIETPLTSRSVFIEEAPVVGGLHVYKTDEVVVETLKTSGHLLHHQMIEHSYPFCWRYKTPLIFRATPQWFISMDKNHLRETAMQAAHQARWLPETGKNRFESMLSGRPDWCISRQRAWGVPITLFINKEDGQLHPNMVAIMEQIATRVEKDGIDAWFECDPAEFLGEEAEQYDKVQDILDVWFDAGVTHYCVLDQRPELSVPADVYLEGSDQHRGWFQSSLLTSVAMREAAPFKAVLTHGFVVDKDGKKMSKSLGNTIAPSEIVNKYGADILRLWVAAADYFGDITVSDEILKRTSDAYRRVRNTARFLLSNLYDFTAETKLESAKLAELDRWAIATTRDYQTKIIAAYQNFQISQVYQLLLNFCTVEMGSFYLDVIKDRLYTAKADSQARRSAQTALFVILQSLVRWLAPILSFTAEEIWSFLSEGEDASIFASEWFAEFGDIDIDLAPWQSLMELRDVVNKELEQRRHEQELGGALDANVTIFADESWLPRLQRLKDELRFVLLVSGTEVKPLAEKSAQAKDTAVSGIALQVEKSTADKCERCWQRRQDVGGQAQYDTLCARCVENVSGQGEAREFA